MQSLALASIWSRLQARLPVLASSHKRHVEDCVHKYSSLQACNSGMDRFLQGGRRPREPRIKASEGKGSEDDQRDSRANKATDVARRPAKGGTAIATRCAGRSLRVVELRSAGELKASQRARARRIRWHGTAGARRPPWRVQRAATAAALHAQREFWRPIPLSVWTRC